MGKRRRKPKIVSSTGIYCEVENPPIRDPEQQIEMWRDFATSFNIQAVLLNVENAALGVLQHFEGDVAEWDGKPVWVKRSSAEFPWAIPKDAHPDAKRAREIMWELHVCREKLSSGDIEFATMAAFRLGRTVEMLRVFPFESHARRSINNAAARTKKYKALKGDPAKKKKICVEEFRKLKKEYPNKNLALLQRQTGIEVAKKMELKDPISPRQVQRYLRDNPKKSS